MMSVVFLLEEPSCKEMLQGLLPKIIPEDITPYYLVFEGKQDLENQLVRKMKNWLIPNTRFIVIRDQDSSDCVILKKRLKSLCFKAGKKDSLVRIACHELESWYFGDLWAVEEGLNLRNLSNFQRKAKYRVPDNIVNPADELMKITNNVYTKIAGSRNIGKHLNPDNNISHSFNVFISGLKIILHID